MTITEAHLKSNHQVASEAHLKSTHQVASDVKEVFGVCKETIFPAGQKNLPTTNSPKECLTKCFMLVNCRVSPYRH